MKTLKRTLAFVAKSVAGVSLQAYNYFYLAHQGQIWPWGSQIAD